MTQTISGNIAIKTYEVETLKSCQQKNVLNGVFASPKRSSLLSLATQAVKNDFPSFFALTEKELQAKVKEIAGNVPFYTTKEKDLAIEKTTFYLFRWFAFLKMNQYKWKESKKIIPVTVEVNGITYENEVVIDFIFEQYGGSLTLVNLSTMATTLSERGQSNETATKSSPMLYFLRLASTQLQAQVGVKVDAQWFHLKGKSESGRDILTTRPHYESNSYFILNAPFVEKFNTSYIFDLVEQTQMQSIASACEEKKACQDCAYVSVCHATSEFTIPTTAVQPKTYRSPLLTINQEKMTQVTNGVYRVNAGAGSGKTTAIVSRCLELLYTHQIPPEKILLITFTNQGAKEIRERLALALDSFSLPTEWAEKMSIDTFNSWGQKFIQSNAQALGYSEAPQLIEKSQSFHFLLENIPYYAFSMRNYNQSNPLMNFFNAKGVVVRLYEQLQAIKMKNLSTVEEVLEDLFKKSFQNQKMVHTPTDEKDATLLLKLYHDYQSFLKLNNLYEYQDQVAIPLTTIDKGQYDLWDAFKYQHIMIDECQDNDRQQFDLLCMLHQLCFSESMMFIGDDSQSIYGFRQADKEIMLELGTHFPLLQDIVFETNFRSTKPIVELSNYLNRQQYSYLPKKIVSGRKEIGTKPVYELHVKKEETYQALIQKVQQQIASGTEPKDICILARTKQELLTIQGYLTEQHIPSTLEVPVYYRQHSAIQAIEQFAHTMMDGSRLGILSVQQHIQQHQQSTWTKEELMDRVDKQAKEIEGLRSVWNAQPVLERQYFFEQIEGLLIPCPSIAPFIKQLKTKNFADNQALYQYLIDFMLFEDDKTMDVATSVGNEVVLSTMHSAKGKEWKVVHVSLLGFAQGSYDRKVRDEELRLLFVAITRAKDILSIYNVVRNKKTILRDELGRLVMEGLA